MHEFESGRGNRPGGIIRSGNKSPNVIVLTHFGDKELKLVMQNEIATKPSDHCHGCQLLFRVQQC